MPKVTLVVAHTRNRVIGRDGGMPWHLPADLARFKAATMGKPMIMGRRTFESIGRALPGRTTIVVTSRGSLTYRGSQSVIGEIAIAKSFDDALRLAGDVPEVMVIGGAQLYGAVLPHADQILLTEIDADVEGDTYFPELDPGEWREVGRETRAKDEKNAYDLAFVVLERVRAA